MNKLKNILLTSDEREQYEQQKGLIMPNAAQNKWMKTVANWYQCHGFSDNELNEYQFQIHHCVGRKAKHNKIAIGHWFVLPLPIALQDLQNE